MLLGQIAAAFGLTAAFISIAAVGLTALLLLWLLMPETQFAGQEAASRTVQPFGSEMMDDRGR
jgi:predicted MFS family arabinose efflux permease